MTSADVGERVRAFSGLRAVPDGLVEQAWREERMRQPPLGWEADCLERLFVQAPAEPIACKRAVVTVASPGFEPMLDTLLQSLYRWGGAGLGEETETKDTETKVIVFAVGDTYDWVRRHHPSASVIRCEAAAPLSAAVKGVLYSCARWVDAERILALECDMLVLSPLAPLWRTSEGLRPEVMAGCRSQVEAERFRLAEVFGHMGCPLSDWEWLTGRVGFPTGHFCFNGGLLVGGRAAWQGLDAAIRRMGRRAVLWVEGAFQEGFKDELLMNLCLSDGGDTAEMAAGWNIQSYDGKRGHWFQTERRSDGVYYSRLGEPAKVLHFVGAQRNLLPEVWEEIRAHGLSAAQAG